MWVRKTHEDFDREREKIDNERSHVWLAFGGPLKISSIAFFIGLVVAFVPPRPWPGQTGGGPDTLAGRLAITPYVALTFAMIAFLVVYLFQVLYGRPALSLFSKEGKFLVCNKCYRVKSPDGQPSCGCGGEFEDFALWKWVEEEGEGKEGH